MTTDEISRTTVSKRRVHLAWYLAGGCALAFVGLTVLVSAGMLVPRADEQLREWFRPHDVWGSHQLFADHFVEGMRPLVSGAVLASVAVVVSLVRRSWRPLRFAGVVGAAAVFLTLAFKVAVGRPDPHNDPIAYGGSFPSGHVVSVMVCAGAALLLLLPRRTSPWLWLVPAACGLVLGVALLVEAAHWTSDVIGGFLLAIAVLAACSRLALRRPEGAPGGPPEGVVTSDGHPSGADVRLVG